MDRIFRMEKMVSRLTAEGRKDEIRPEDYELMKELDGKKGSDYNFRSVVYGENVVWIDCDGGIDGVYVNAADCE